MLKEYVYKNQQKLRCGYTTGSCAAGAAKAAAMMLLKKDRVDTVKLMTPKGIELNLNIEDIDIKPSVVRCAVRKDGGDDADATDNMLIFASVSCLSEKKIIIDGGAGVGRVTKPGLNQPVGKSAINSVPRMMIRKEVEAVCAAMKYEGGIQVIIEVPEGAVVAERTFNPRLGIAGGISILGTSGIVEPMSERALIDTIQIEINMKRANGLRNLLVTPGNYGLDYVKGNTKLSYKNAVKCSNFIGETLDMAVNAGFEKFLFVGHIGKLVKIGAGIMNTHSKYADGRMEVLTACAVEANADIKILKKLLLCNTTDDAIDLLKAYGIFPEVMDKLMHRIEWHMRHRVMDKLEIGILTFSNKHGLLGKTDNADNMLLNDFY